MAVITKELAERIVRKLKARIITGKKAHDIAQVYNDGKLVAWFGIRRSSNKDKGHDHIPEQIFLRPREAKLLGECPLSREEWLKILAGKGLLEDSQS